MALDRYITNYITKGERNATNEIWEACNKTKSMRSQLKSFALRQLKSRECDVYEACDKLLGHKMHLFSHKVYSLVTIPKNKRKHCLKTIDEIKKMRPDDTNI
jgi:hypothetical protein